LNTNLKYEKKIIEEIQDLPEEDIPKLLDMIHYLKEGILSDRKKKEAKDIAKDMRDPLLDLEDIAVETGIPDLAQHHDHYLYGSAEG
jgi:hypothetical protein